MVGAITHFQSQAASLPVAWLAQSAPSPEAVVTCAGAAAFSPSSRTLFMAKDAGAFTLQRPSSSCVVEASREKPHGVGPVFIGLDQPFIAVIRLGECFQFSSPGFQYRAQEGLEGPIGAFHPSIPMQFNNSSRLGALEQ